MVIEWKWLCISLSFEVAFCVVKGVSAAENERWVECSSNFTRVCVDKSRQYDPNVGVVPSCIGSEFDKDTLIKLWSDIPTDDILDAAFIARSFLRYKVSSRLNSKEINKTFLDPTRDFRYHLPSRFWIDGVCSTNLSVFITPFIVENPISRNKCFACLVVFVGPDRFCLAVYVNMNTGEAGLDFRSISGCPFLVSRISCFPFLTSDEVSLQTKLIRLIVPRRIPATKLQYKHKHEDLTPDVDVKFDG